MCVLVEVRTRGVVRVRDHSAAACCPAHTGLQSRVTHARGRYTVVHECHCSLYLVPVWVYMGRHAIPELTRYTQHDYYIKQSAHSLTHAHAIHREEIASACMTQAATAINVDDFTPLTPRWSYTNLSPTRTVYCAAACASSRI